MDTPTQPGVNIMSKPTRAELKKAISRGLVRTDELLENLETEKQPTEVTYHVWANLISVLIDAGWTVEELTEDISFYDRYRILRTFT
jgi:hypothetical protein